MAAPADCTAGVCTVRLVADFAVMVAVAPPNVTPVGADKLVPVMVTAVPPTTEPVAGLIFVTVGAGTGVTWFDADDAGPVPTAFVAVTVKI